MAGLQTDAVPDDRSYKILLKKITDQLARRDLNIMKFLCRDHIQESKLEDIKAGTSLLLELEDKCLIKHSDLSFLSELLFLVGRRDVLRRNMNIDAIVIERRLDSGLSHLKPFRVLMHKICTETTEKSLNDLKYVFADDFSASDLEKTKDMWQFMSLMEERELVSPVSLETMDTIIDQMERPDLNNILQHYRDNHMSKSMKTHPEHKSSAKSPTSSLQSTGSYPEGFRYLEPAKKGETKIQQSYLARQLVGNTESDLKACHVTSHVTEDTLPHNVSSGSLASERSENQVVSHPVQATEEHDVNPYLFQRQLSGSTPSPLQRKEGLELPGDRSAHSTHGTPETHSQQGHQDAESCGAEQQDEPQLNTDVTSPLATNENLTRQVHPFNQGALSRQAHAREQTVPSSTTATLNDLPSYKMEANPRGHCVIINNENFHQIPGDHRSKKLNNRPGSSVDAANLERTFNRLGFQVTIYKDRKAPEVYNILKGLSMESHRPYDALVVCILSHGALGTIFGSDGRRVVIGHILSYFKPDQCASLANKPKIFIIQACQGKEKQPATVIHTDDAGERNDLSDYMEIPNDADFLIGYATVAGFVSFRHEDDGTWYIDALQRNLNQHCKQHDVLSILTAVNAEVAQKLAPPGERDERQNYKQMPTPYTTLTKKLFLRPITQ